MFVTDESGYGLAGALDGQNRSFTTSQTMRIDLPVEVYQNGDRMVAGLEDGFDVVNPRTIRLRVAPAPEDTVAVKFSADPPPIAIMGGVPQITMAQVLGAPITITATVVSEP